MKRWLIVVAASAAISSNAAAQDVRSDAVACRDTATVGMYRRCALWIDGQRVRRGEEGVVVARPGFFTPPRITRVVVGDSAMAYSQLFERRARQATGFFAASGVLLGAAFASMDQHCRQNSVGTCEWGGREWTFVTLAGSSLVSTIMGASLQTRANRAAGKAVWWNNLRFSR